MCDLNQPNLLFGADPSKEKPKGTVQPKSTDTESELKTLKEKP